VAPPSWGRPGGRGGRAGLLAEAVVVQAGRVVRRVLHTASAEVAKVPLEEAARVGALVNAIPVPLTAIRMGSALAVSVHAVHAVHAAHVHTHVHIVDTTTQFLAIRLFIDTLDLAIYAPAADHVAHVAHAVVAPHLLWHT